VVLHLMTASTVNFLDGDGGSGALSAFRTRNPIYYLGDGAGWVLGNNSAKAWD